MDKLEAAKRIAANGGEYWMAREIQNVIGYAKWENFKSVVSKSIASCREGGIDSKEHFLGTRKMVTIGNGAKVEIDDFFLTRYACYLVAMNGEAATHPEVASAQRYFAVQTRLQELDRKQLNYQERVRLRGRLREATKHLHSAAAKAGVQEYALFHHAGYLGLYDMGLRDVKKKKGLKPTDDLYDHAGRFELSVNEFKAQLTEKSLIQKGIKGQQAAQNEHKRVGKIVRETVHREAGIYPEDLKAEPPIKAIESLPKTGLGDQISN